MYFFGKQFFWDDDNLTNQGECVVFAANKEQDDLASYACFPALTKIRLFSPVFYFVHCVFLHLLLLERREHFGFVLESPRNIAGLQSHCLCLKAERFSRLELRVCK